MSTTYALPDALARALAADFPADFLSTDADDLATYGRDWLPMFEPAPVAIAFPRTTEEVARLVALCNQHDVAMVPSGGRTGLAGGAVARNGELVISTVRMNRMDPVDPLAMTVRVQAGAITEAVHQHAAEHGLTWPVDFASKGSSCVGGNIATNAGGVNVIRYGSTRNWVLSLQVVDAAGRVLELGGDLEKNNTGLDLRQLFIGSEGTLGVVTEATLKLTTLPGERSVLLFALDAFDDVLQVFQSVRQSGFTVMAYEFFTQRCSARLQAHRGLSPPLSPAPFYALVELEDADEEGLLSGVESVLEKDGVRDGTMAQNLGQIAELWALREGISESLSSTGLPHKNDVALPLRQLGSFHRAVEQVFARHYPDWEICLFGHIGDGNLHINVMKPDDMDKDEFVRHTHEADRLLFDIVRQHGGSISAEHGIGLLKRDFLGYSRTDDELAVMRGIKQVLDPKNLLNPGKIFSS